ncbi:unnamed protein product [Dibothriocephalus latus]|uniref:Uncharacterized protein n=1 Tax=Dibothriocephalus latus TaxID=60516 RepID=A0A3P7NDV4_DIBLA|nr:unnamed protein product [Dibothriocephalus latus]
MASSWMVPAGIARIESWRSPCQRFCRMLCQR